MENKANIIRKYAEAGPARKVDIICKYYSQIDGIINARIAGMKYYIWEEKEKSRRGDRSELGVRVQSGNRYSDPTGKEGVFRGDLEKAIRNCDFSGDILDGIENKEQIIEEAYVLRDMKAIRKLYDEQIGSLIEADRRVFVKYLNHEKTLTELAVDEGVEYNSIVKWVVKIKKYLKQEVVEVLEITGQYARTGKGRRGR